MLGKRLLASAYATVLTYSLSCGLAYGGEPIKQVAKNNPSQSQPYSKVRVAEIDTKQERQLGNSRLDKVTQSNNSPIPWATRGAAEQGYYRSQGLNIINFRF